MTLAAAQAGDDEAFASLVEPYRRELRQHCYRMLASLDDADDALQETLLAAWRGLPGFQGRSSLRTWLYRIATRVCLRMAERRPVRVLSWDAYPARRPDDDLGEPTTEPAIIDPWLEDPADPEPTAVRREVTGLAYVAALQQLPANQRAVLILRDVLDFSAAETAGLLDTSVASANSALQRARAGVASRPSGFSTPNPASQHDHRLVDRFVAAFERRDLDALVALLAADVRFTMPPLPAWFTGRDDVAQFYRERVFALRWQQIRVPDVSGQPTLLGYSEQDGALRLGALQVLHLRDGEITWVASFLDPAVLRRLGRPDVYEEPPGDR